MGLITVSYQFYGCFGSSRQTDLAVLLRHASIQIRCYNGDSTNIFHPHLPDPVSDDVCLRGMRTLAGPRRRQDQEDAQLLEPDRHEPKQPETLESQTSKPDAKAESMGGCPVTIIAGSNNDLRNALHGMNT